MASGSKGSNPSAKVKLRIFLDANVLFSAARASGAMRQLLTALKAQGHALVADEYVHIEARRNLAAKADAEALQHLEMILADVELGGARSAISPEQAQAVQWLPDKDRPVLLAAIALRCDALVTGDKTHFGSGYGQCFAGVKLYSPAMLASDFLIKPS
jgi:predicted nucleic acid-binding protein